MSCSADDYSKAMQEAMQKLVGERLRLAKKKRSEAKARRRKIRKMGGKAGF